MKKFIFIFSSLRLKREGFWGFGEQYVTEPRCIQNSYVLLITRGVPMDIDLLGLDAYTKGQPVIITTLCVYTIYTPNR
jgi:hypothetical protein